MTAEVAFAKSFLASLDSRPIKLQPDYAADQRTIQPRGPYTLPKMPHAMKAPNKDSAPGSGPSITVLLKSPRSPQLNLQLPSQPLTTSVLELKQRVAKEVGLEDTAKIRLLYNKKPCSDSKSIKDLVADAVPTIEFSVMFIGGVPTKVEEVPGAQGSPSPDVKGIKDAAELSTAAFWTDLEAFLQQRLGSRAAALEASRVFKHSWEENGKSL